MFRLPRLPVGPLPARSLLVAFAKSVPRSANLSTRCLHSTLLPLSPAHVRLYSTPQQQAPPTPPSNAGVPAPSTSRTDFQKLSYKSILFLGLSGLSLLLYFNHEKNKIEKSRETLKDVSAGKPKVGGPFALTDHNGNPATDKDFRGKWMLVYFGYTFCPDVCPDELDKMAAVVEKLKVTPATAKAEIVPIFISCDPKRDTPAVIKEYLKEFHPDFLGMTGTYDQIKVAAKAYRLYFSAPPKSMENDEVDYLVDHSIFFYLMDPEGKYKAHFGKIDGVDRVVERCVEELSAFRPSS